LLCSAGWPGIHGPPASASQVQGLQTCATTPGVTYFCHTSYEKSSLPSKLRKTLVLFFLT
jgi:hypothetical protein